VARALQLVDVRDPSSPRLIAEGNLCEIDESWDVAAGGDLAYLTVKSKLYVFDPKGGIVPQWSGHYDSPEPVVDVAVRDRTVFVLTAHRIVVLDATDPAAIDLQVEVRWASGASAVKGVVATGELSGVPMLAVSTNEALLLYDVTDPAVPSLVGTYTYASGNDRYVALALDGDSVYGAPARGGLEVLGLREADRGRHELFLPTALRPHAVGRSMPPMPGWALRTSF
jgi:hypothetical protein